MIKLNYHLTYTFTGRDIQDPAAPDLIYKARVHRPAGWTKQVIEFNKDRSPKLAYQIIGGLIISISQDGIEYPMNVEQAEALRNTIEEQNPGMGDEYICVLAWGIYVKHVDYEDDRLKNLPEPLSVSENGSGMKLEKSLVVNP